MKWSLHIVNLNECDTIRLQYTLGKTDKNWNRLQRKIIYFTRQFTRCTSATESSAGTFDTLLNTLFLAPRTDWFGRAQLIPIVANRNAVKAESLTRKHLNYTDRCRQAEVWKSE
jgi:hypothetical protein